MTKTSLQVAQIVPVTQAEGPGIRFALWFQGCPLRCPSCCNPEMLSFEGGEAVQLEEVLEQISQARDGAQIEGITLLGGEPFAHARTASPLATEVQELGLTVMIFSGYTLEELKDRRDPEVDTLLANTDILVDGPYDKTQPDRQRRWIGSKNQRIHFLTEKYSAEDQRWQAPNTLELRLEGNQLTVNGFPSAHTKPFWRRPEKMLSPVNQMSKNDKASACSSALEVLEGKTIADRRKALESLKGQSPSVEDLRQLHQAAESTQVEIRRRASEILGTVHISPPTLVLLQSIARDPAWTVREAWHRTLLARLRTSQTSDAIPPQVAELLYEQALRDRNELVRSGAMSLLRTWPDKSQQSQIATSGLEILSRNHERTPVIQRSIRSLLALHQSQQLPPKQQKSIVDHLRVATRNAHRKIRRTAVQAIGQLKQDSATCLGDVLVRCYDRDQSVARAATQTLHSLLDRASLPVGIVELLSKTESTQPLELLTTLEPELSLRVDTYQTLQTICGRRRHWRTAIRTTSTNLERVEATQLSIRAYLEECAQAGDDLAHKEAVWLLGQTMELLVADHAAAS